MDILSIVADLQREPNFKILVGEYVDKTIIIFDETAEETEKSIV
jgi:hypothetical protein